MKTFLTTSLLFAGTICFAQQSTISRTIHFASNQSAIAAADQRWIDSAMNIVNGNTYTITIKAYCDADGSDAANMALSEQRAVAVESRFIKAKATRENIHASHFGESDPLADNTTDVGKALNRRALVEINYSGKSPAGPVIASDVAPASTMVSSPQSLSHISANDLKVGQSLVLKNINFEGGSSVLLDESVPTLQELLTLMHNIPTLQIEIGGHVCCGPDMPLSIARAKRVYEYLRNRGVSASRMTYKGYSFDKPIASETTEEGKQMNRRVEITVISK